MAEVTLRAKILALVAGVTFFAATGVAAVALWREVLRGQELLAREGAAIAASVAADAAHWLGPEGQAPAAPAALRPVLDRLLGSAPLDRAWVVDRAGHVVACAERRDQGCPDGTPTVFAPSTDPIAALTRLVQPGGIVTGAPVIREGQVVGAVRIDYQHEEVVGSARRVAGWAAIVAGFWIALGLLLATELVRRITEPLARVADAAERLSDSPGVQLEVPSDFELAELANAFNAMSRRLEERRLENVRLIASLEARVAQKTREVLRADRLATLGGTAAGFAHEIGNALNVVRGYTEVILRELPADHANRADLDVVRREVQRSAALIERFLVFARARTTTPEVQPIEPVLRDAVEVVRPVAAQAHVASSVEIEDGLPPVKIDAELLRQAFLNLCINAIQAMQAHGGTLAVRARRNARTVAIEFQDTGPGLDPEVQRSVFEPFFTTKPDGTGLGLAIVRQAAEAHGGTVEVESRLGHGALFRISLPAEELA